MNVDSNGQNITADAANEPSISVDPTNRNKMVIGWRQFNRCRLEFPPGRLGIYQQWRGLPDFPRSAENNVFLSDPRPGV